jgi:hypothetical protein
MALKFKSLFAAAPKISSVLSPKFQLSSLTDLIKPAISSLINSTDKSSPIDLSSLAGSLPSMIHMISNLTSSSSKPALNAETLNILMQTLQPLLQSLNGSSSTSQTQLLQSLPTVIKSITSLMTNFDGQTNSSESISNAITALKPLLTQLAASNTNTDTAQIVSTLNKVLAMAQPIIQIAGTGTSSNADLADIAKVAAQSLMPLLASINTGNSNIDMAMLQKALPSVIGSVTALISTLTQANSNNIPETISGVLKGVNPLLKLLAESGSLDTSQTETVNAVYNVLNSVKTVLDLVNNPSLLTLSADLNKVLDSFKPVVEMLDQKGDFSDLLSSVQIPNLGDLLGSIHSSAQKETGSATDQTSDIDLAALPNLSDLISGSSQMGNIDLSQISSQLTGAVHKVAGIMPLASGDLSILTQLIPSIEITQPAPYI